METVVLTKVVTGDLFQVEVISKNEPNKGQVTDIAGTHMEKIYGSDQVAFSEYKTDGQGGKIYVFHDEEERRCVAQVMRAPLFEFEK